MFKSHGSGLCLNSTSVAVSVVQCRAVVSGRIRCDGADTGLTPSTVWAWPSHWVADAAVSHPSRCTAVQTGLPGQIQLPDCGQLSSERNAAIWRWGQRQSAWDGGVKHLTCRSETWQFVKKQIKPEGWLVKLESTPDFGKACAEVRQHSILISSFSNINYIIPILS